MSLSGSISVQFVLLPNTETNLKWERAVVRWTIQIDLTKSLRHFFMTAKSYSKKKQVDRCDLEKQLEKYAVVSLIFGLNHTLTHVL